MTTFTFTQHTEISTQPEVYIEERQRIFQLISLLLQYPDEEWLDCKALYEEVAEIGHSEIKQYLFSFLEYLEGAGLDEAMVNYVSTFDFNSKVALYLTYSNTGEERERGQSLLKLKQIYESAGLLMTDQELPDYLPLFLEFVAIAPLPVVVEVLKDYRGAIGTMHESLQSANSPYVFLLLACVTAIDELLQADETIC